MRDATTASSLELIFLFEADQSQLRIEIESAMDPTYFEFTARAPTAVAATGEEPLHDSEMGEEKLLLDRLPPLPLPPFAPPLRLRDR